MRRRRGGARRWVRWGGLSVTTLLLVLWIASAFVYVQYNFSTGMCGVGRGRVGAAIAMGGQDPDPAGWNWEPVDVAVDSRLGWLPVVGRKSGYFQTLLPLWPLWLLAAAFTAWRFHTDSVPAPGACPSCGYDRRGLVAGDAKCPECGTTPTLPSK